MIVQICRIYTLLGLIVISSVFMSLNGPKLGLLESRIFVLKHFGLKSVGWSVMWFSVLLLLTVFLFPH